MSKPHWILALEAVAATSAEVVAKEAENVHPNPSPAQAQAGNYRKAHITWNGLDIAIETPKGGTRRAHDGSWKVENLPAHYGYIKRTEGADGDHVDVYVGDALDSDDVFVVDQRSLETGKFDETKSMLGFKSLEAAKKAYIGGFSDGKGPDRIQAITATTVAAFKRWIDSSEHHKAFSEAGTPMNESITDRSKLDDSDDADLYSSARHMLIIKGNLSPSESQIEKEMDRLFMSRIKSDPDFYTEGRDGRELLSIKREFDRNEDNNRHTENAVLLAKNFGSTQELADAKAALALRDKDNTGWDSSDPKQEAARQKIDAITRKYYPQLRGLKEAIAPSTAYKLVQRSNGKIVAAGSKEAMHKRRKAQETGAYYVALTNTAVGGTFGGWESFRNRPMASKLTEDKDDKIIKWIRWYDDYHEIDRANMIARKSNSQARVFELDTESLGFAFDDSRFSGYLQYPGMCYVRTTSGPKPSIASQKAAFAKVAKAHGFYPTPFNESKRPMWKNILSESLVPQSKDQAAQEKKKVDSAVGDNAAPGSVEYKDLHDKAWEIVAARHNDKNLDLSEKEWTKYWDKIDKEVTAEVKLLRAQYAPKDIKEAFFPSPIPKGGEQCPQCHGYGFTGDGDSEDDDSDGNCKRCGGKGRIQKDIKEAFRPAYDRESSGAKICPECGEIWKVCDNFKDAGNRPWVFCENCGHHRDCHKPGVLGPEWKMKRSLKLESRKLREYADDGVIPSEVDTNVDMKILRRSLDTVANDPKYVGLKLAGSDFKDDVEDEYRKDHEADPHDTKAVRMTEGRSMVMGLIREAGPAKAKIPTNVDRIKAAQEKEKEDLAARQFNAQQAAARQDFAAKQRADSSKKVAKK